MALVLSNDQALASALQRDREMRQSSSESRGPEGSSVARLTRWCSLVAALLLACEGEQERPAPPVTSWSEPVEVTVVEDPDAGISVDAAVLADARARPARPPDESGLFDPRQDDEILRALRDEEIVAVERGPGVRSLLVRITLAHGARA